jgi:hypothetical protein
MGLDAVDGTPVLDIKPILPGFLPRGDVVESASAADIMKDYWRVQRGDTRGDRATVDAGVAGERVARRIGLPAAAAGLERPG